MHALAAAFATLLPLQTPAPAKTFTPPQMQCLQSPDEQVCGYRCERNYNQTKCTRTPFGRCVSQHDQVLCWDPPPGVIAVLGDDVPEPQCITNFGKLACGYSCVAQSGEIKCAQTPFGVCGGQFGKVECFDPPLQSLSLVEGEIPRPQCVANFGVLACGYGCVAQFGQVKCAQTALGSCTAQRGEVTCVDPPVDGLPIVRRLKPAPAAPAPQPSCLRFRGENVCGYGCASSSTDARCARTPSGRCFDTGGGRISCVE